MTTSFLEDHTLVPGVAVVSLMFRYGGHIMMRFRAIQH